VVALITDASHLASLKRLATKYEDDHPYRGILNHDIQMTSHNEAVRLLDVLKRRYRGRVVKGSDGVWRSPCPACGAGEEEGPPTLAILDSLNVSCGECERGLEAILAHRRTGAQCEVCGAQDGLRRVRLRVGRREEWVARCEACLPKKGAWR
jgi:hypothetical protein